MSAHPSPVDREQHVGHSPTAGTYEQAVEAHVEHFRAYVRRVLDRAAEGRGGRIGVEDTLQDALLKIYERWPQVSVLDEQDRNWHMYRCVRDAAVRALRREYGARERSSPRPQFIPYDFAALDVLEDVAPVRDREMAAAVLGGLARDVGAADASGEVLGRAMLLAGLSALTEHETVVLIAVDHLGWDQERLAEHLEVPLPTLRETLFVARKLLTMMVRHASEIEVGDEEQARLAAYRAGELKGAERRAMARHLGRCRACQTLDARRQAFGHGAAQVLSPLPCIAAAGHVLAPRAVIKSAPVKAATGLFGTPGATKVVVAVVSLLVAGGAGAAILAAVAERRQQQPDDALVVNAGGYPPPSGMRRIEMPAVAPRTPRQQHHRRHRVTQQHKDIKKTPPVKIAPPTTTTTTTTTPQVQQSRPHSTSTGSSCEFFCG